MLAARYEFHFKRLGKLAFMYQTALANDTSMTALLAVTLEEFADGLPDCIPSELTIEPYVVQMGANLTNPALAAVAKNCGAAYLIADDFTKDLTTTIATPKNVATVLNALATEMSAGVDNKTLTTLAATGLVAFFNAYLPSPGTWNSASDATANYKDSVYVTSTFV